jgi:hypothetical protein
VCSCQYRCRRCGSYKGYSSRSRNFIEKFLIPLLLLRSARLRELLSAILRFDMRETSRS